MSALRDDAARAGVLRGFRRPRLWVALWCVMIAGVVALSMLPPRGLPPVSLVGGDKLGHLLGYAALSTYAGMLFARAGVQLRAGAGLMAMGVALEFMQATLTDTRSADVFDALANTAGVLLGLALARTRVASWLQWVDARMP